MSEKLKKEQSKINFNKLEEARPISLGAEVRVTIMNHIVEILHMTREPKGLFKIKRIDKYRYQNLETGEILEYRKNENRGQNLESLRKTFKELRKTINNNFTGAKNEIFETLTFGSIYICLKKKWITKKQVEEAREIYRQLEKRKELGEILVMQGWITGEQLQSVENDMRDTKYLYNEVRKFVQRLKYRYGSIDYINVVEPQGRGVWHCHILLKFNDMGKVFIKNNEIIAPMWGNGFTVTHDLKSVDNIGAYVNAYLADLKVCEENNEEIFKAMVYNESAWDVVEDENGNLHSVKNHGKVDLRLVEKEVIEDGKKVKKQYLKGGRLHMYPIGIQLYRTSDGIKKPETNKMKYYEAKKIVGFGEANYSRTIDLDKDGMSINSITYEQYNIKRDKNVYQNKVK